MLPTGSVDLSGKENRFDTGSAAAAQPDGTFEQAPGNVEAWWQSVPADPRAGAVPPGSDTLGFNRGDTAVVSCDDRKMSRTLKIDNILSLGHRPDEKLSDAIATFVYCQRSGKRCRLAYRQRQSRR